MIEQAYLYLILVGLTIGSVMVTLWIMARRASRLNLELIRLNEQLQFDTPTFLNQAWSLLAKSSLRGMAWELDWFGVPTTGQGGLAKGRATRRRIDVGEMGLALTFYRHEGRGEQRYFEETLIETLVLLLRTDMLIKAGTTDAALSHMSKLNLFLQHDMKNIAQFIQLMGDQLGAVPAGKEQKVLEYLRVATPLIRHRADRIVRTLTVGAVIANPGPPKSLAVLVEQLCALYGLQCHVTGDCVAAVAGNVLETVLDNILKNYQDLSVRDQLPPLTMECTIGAQDDMVELTLYAPDAPRAAEPERLFEPFWSSTPEGLGIGLFQARHLIATQGGALFVSQAPEGPLRFHIRCPVAHQTVLQS